MTARLLKELAGHGMVQGRHVVVTAHADDEVITFGAALRRLAAATIVQLTTSVSGRGPDYGAQVEARHAERAAAAVAGGWRWPIVDGHVAARDAHRHLGRLLELVSAALVDTDVVWTHPYEGGHLDHDAAAWLVQTACARMATPPLRMEFASYHAQGFGVFSPVASATVVRPVSGQAWLLKRQALRAYASQAHIIRKFPSVQVEHYRIAPVYDFTRPAVPVSRWDAKGYQPPMAALRDRFAAFERESA